MSTWGREHAFSNFTFCSLKWAQPKHVQGRSDLCPDPSQYSIFVCQWYRKQHLSFKAEFPAVVLWGPSLWWAREERGNFLYFCGLSCSTRRKCGNALFIKVTGHESNGFPSMAARGSLGCGMSWVLLKSCSSPLSSLPQKPLLGWPLSWQGIWARDKMLLSLSPACLGQHNPLQCSDW